MWDDPAEIKKKAQEQGYDVIFQISANSPFYTDFCVWLKKKG